MIQFRRTCAVLLYVSLSAGAQDRETVASLLLRFQQAHDLAGKEAILSVIIGRGYGVGQPLLQLARTTGDNDTRWFAIRGLGRLKFEEAAPFLVEALKSDEHYVRANAARALGELGYSNAGPALIQVLQADQDAGVIEQTSLALRMIRATDAVPVIKSRMSFNSVQTRCWLLDALAMLGSKDDLPFIAKYLYNSATVPEGLPLCAARTLANLTGQDFGLPEASGLFDGQTPVMKARKWWEQNSAGRAR